MVKNGQFSAEAAYLHFGITNSDVVFQWLQAFEKQGINGLILKPKSRPIMKPKYPKMPPKPKTWREELELENLLRAENAILKKLQELNQQKRLEDAKPNFTFRPRLAVSNGRLSGDFTRE